MVTSDGSIRNVEWLDGAGLAAGFWGVGCDAGCRAFDIHGVVTTASTWRGTSRATPHVLYDYQFLAMEHWDNAVLGAEVAAHNMVSFEPDYRLASRCCPASGRASSASTSSPSACLFADEIVFTQGSVRHHRFVAAYGRRGRIVAAVTFNHAQWINHHDDRAVGAVSSRHPPGL